eukprot:Sspe_Gene.73619::Locus_44600_Transcript_1_3_Confidence_0.286_Length_1163::g.73619::m.73619
MGCGASNAGTAAPSSVGSPRERHSTIASPTVAQSLKIEKVAGPMKLPVSGAAILVVQGNEFVLAYYSQGADCVPQCLPISTSCDVAPSFDSSFAHSSPITDLTPLMENTALLTCAKDGQLLVWVARKEEPRVFVVFKTLRASKLKYDSFPFSKVCGSLKGQFAAAALAESLVAESLVEEESDSVNNSTSVVVWMVSTGRQLCFFEEHSVEVSAIDFSANREIASGDRHGALMIWDPMTGKVKHRIDSAHSSAIMSLSFSHSRERANYLASMCTSRLVVWEVSCGMKIHEFTNDFLSVPALRILSFVSASHLLVSTSGSGRVMVIEADSGTVAGKGITPSVVTAVASKGRICVMGCNDGTVVSMGMDSLLA